MNVLLAQFGSMGWPEMMIVGVIALLLFGKRLPEVARSLGKGMTEFKKGLSGVQDEIEEATRMEPATQTSYRELPHATEPQVAQAPKFEPPAAQPTQAASSTDAAQLQSLAEVEKHQNAATS